MKKRIILVLSALLVVSTLLSACGNNASNGDKQLTVQIGPDPETIDPALNSAVDGANMILHTHECLMLIAEDGTIVPGQAESFEVSEDGMTYTFHLRDGLKWSDGSDLTAADFVYSWKRVCDPLVAAPYAETVLSMVKGYDEAIEGDFDALAVSAPDDQTFVVELSSICSYFDSLAAFPTLSPVQQKIVEELGDQWAISADSYIGNGAFVMTEWVPGSHITLSKNKKYWDADSIKLDSIKFLLIEDANASYSAYQSEGALMIKDVPTEEIASLEGNDDFYLEPIIGTYYLSMQTEKEPFNDPLVRKALSLAIDREYVANTVMGGTYSPASNFMGPGWSDLNGTDFMDNANGGNPYIDNSTYEANVEEAKSLLEKAGYKDGEGIPTIVYSTNDSGYHKVVAEYIQQAWSDIGITVEVEVLEWSSFSATRRGGDYMVARNGWVGDYSDPSNMLTLLVSTNGNNDGKYNNVDFDAAMEIAQTSIDPEERYTKMHEAEDILMADAACIPVAYYSDFWLQSNKVVGSWHSSYGFWHFQYADITE